MFNYPQELVSPERAEHLPDHTYVGSLLRDDHPDSDVTDWLASSDEPFVYVSFGSFLSARGDILSRVAEALRDLGVRAAIAHGSSPRSALGPVPKSWLVREFLPQVTLLRHAAATVNHGGNNSVTEALAYRVPLVVLPFSTDQFAGAAAVERSGRGIALDPQAATPQELSEAVRKALHSAEVWTPMTDEHSGAERAYQHRRILAP